MTMTLIRGQKLKLTDVLSSLQFFVNVAVQSPFVVDVALFGLSHEGKLASDDYMVFYNQPTSPCQSLKLTQNTPAYCQFLVDLARLPNTIQKMVITLTIDGADVMRNLGNSSVSIANTQGQTLINFALNGTMFAQERAIMALELYQKDGIWRMGAVGQGFEGGLPALVRHFGAEVADETTPPTSSATHAPQSSQANQTRLDLKKKLSLEKAQKTGNQAIIDLTKKSLITLEKKGLLDVKARVALVLDASGSMSWQYRNGDVQKVVNRLMPLAINFDDDGSFECWAFACRAKQLPEVTLSNVGDFISRVGGGYERWGVGYSNDEPKVIKEVIEYYQRFNDSIPTYVLFISDGGVGSSRQIERLLTECASLPIFWQFVGIGGSHYGILEHLDDMAGRVVDNCNFFSLDSIGSISDDRLYELLLAEFPLWLDKATRLGLLNNRTFNTTATSTSGTSLLGRWFGL